jgi:hypothetical protein
MDGELCRQQARRARALAERADPFIKRRLLALADEYDVKEQQFAKSALAAEPPISLALNAPIQGLDRPSEA